MGPGHLGIGFAAKSAAPKAPLWLLLVASELTDILFYIFSFSGIEKESVSTTDFINGVQNITPGYVAWSHGLFMNIIWALLAGGISYLIFKNRRIGIVTVVVVFSHWILDFIVHPGLPVWFKKLPLAGLYLWGSGTGLKISLLMEFILLGSGILLYILAKKKKFILFSGGK